MAGIRHQRGVKEPRQQRGGQRLGARHPEETGQIAKEVNYQLLLNKKSM